jgi:SPP1 gp7 family putative phage head morphogenesis protein
MPDQLQEPTVIRLLRSFREALLAREDAQLTRMAKQWLMIERLLENDMIILAAELLEAKFKGLPITLQLIARMTRYQVLKAQLKKEVLKYAREKAVADIAAEQLAYTKHGIDGAATVIKTIKAGIQFKLLSPDALTDYIGMLGDKTPLYRLLKEAYPDALDGVIKGLLNGVARGVGPNQIAKEMAQGMGLGLQRITLIARTEQLRMWRTSTAKQYEESGVVKYSRRLATKDTRVCMSCLMRDGEVIPPNEILSDHPRGRCTSVPVVVGAPEIKWELGKDWFLRQDEATQREMMGQGMYNLWKETDFPIQDLVGTAESKVWGNSPRVKSLQEMRDA